jgi:glycosyltransferase involved in cell wall biosynthesis
VKVLLAVHGWPEAQAGAAACVGGTEQLARRSALALAAAGADVTVVAGALERAASGEGVAGAARLSRTVDGPLQVIRLRRGDLYFDHWQKARSVPVAERFSELLAAEGPDVLLVHHWIRLSRDLVYLAARAGVPALVYLHDHWTSCLRTFRLAPTTAGVTGAAGAADAADEAGVTDEAGAADEAGVTGRANADGVTGATGDFGAALCTQPFGSSCISCAATLFPRTPWVSMENLYMAFAAHERELARELSLARVLITPSEAHRELLLRGRGVDLAGADGTAGPRRARAGGPGRWQVLAPPALPLSRVGSPFERPAAPSPASGGAAARPLVLGCWGQLAPHKGTDLLLAAVSELAATQPVELHLAGEAEEAFAAQLSRAARGLTVHFHGPFERDELPHHAVSAVHAFVCPSRAPESHGLVWDEARALGLPAVLPRGGAFPERAAGEESGVLFYAPGDGADLARVLGRLGQEEHLLARLGEAAEAGARRLAAAGAAPEVPEVQWGRSLLELCARAVEEGAPPTKPPDWFEAPMAREGERTWDAALSRTPPEELGA